MPRFLRLSLVALLAAGLLTACGKRGALDPSPGATEQKEDKSSSGLNKRTPITAPKRDLLIDRLLD